MINFIKTVFYFFIFWLGFYYVGISSEEFNYEDKFLVKFPKIDKKNNILLPCMKINEDILLKRNTETNNFTKNELKKRNICSMYKNLGLPAKEYYCQSSEYFPKKSEQKRIFFTVGYKSFMEDEKKYGKKTMEDFTKLSEHESKKFGNNPETFSGNYSLYKNKGLR